MFQYLNVGLTYVVIGLGAAILGYFVLRMHTIGGFFGALIIGLVGAALGGLFDQVFAELIQRLASFNSVNVFAAFFFAFLLIWVLARLSAPR